MRISRRMGTGPTAACPNMVELTDGRFAIIGDGTTVLSIDDFEGLSVAERKHMTGKRIVAIDRKTLMCAKRDIPDSDSRF